MDMYKSLGSPINQYVAPGIGHPVLQTLVTLFVIGYAAALAPQLPSQVLGLVNNVWVRIAALSVIVFYGTQNPVVSVLVAVAFIGTLNALRGKSMFEGMIGPKTAILPGCLNYTVADLLESFDGDQEALLSAMVQARVPLSVRLTDEYAGLIATYLLSYGIKLKDGPCQL